MLWEEEHSLLGRWVPVPAGGLSLAPLLCSKPVMMMSSPPLPHTQGCQHPNPASSRWALPAPSQGGVPSTETLAGAWCRITGSVLPCLQCSHFLVTPVRAHIVLRAHLAGAHHQHIWLQSSQVKSDVSSASASSARGAQASSHVPVGSLAPSHGHTSRVCREGPQEMTQQHFGQQEHHLQQPHRLPAPCSWPLGVLSRVTV